MLDIDKQYAATFARQHAIYEKKIQPIFYRALADSILPVITSLNPAFIRKDVWQKAYQKAYRMIGQIAGMREYKYLKRVDQKADEVSFLNELFSQRMASYGLTIAWDFETELTGTTLGQIQKALEEAGLNNLTGSQTAKLIRDYTLGTIGRNRSLLIARTETTTIANKAKELAAEEYFKEIGESNGYKLWITRMDGHERHDHAIANNTAVPFGDNFIVGGFDANLPGDPKLPAKERVRCRCTFVTLTERGYRKRFPNG